jgi:hypothetical protein
MSVQNAISKIIEIYSDSFSLARIFSMLSVGGTTFSEKLEVTARSIRVAKWCKDIERELVEPLQLKLPEIKYSPDIAVSLKNVTVEDLEMCASNIAKMNIARLLLLRTVSLPESMSRRFSPIVEEGLKIFSVASIFFSPLDGYGVACRVNSSSIDFSSDECKGLRGLKSVFLPSQFKLGESVLTKHQPRFDYNYINTMEYLWHRSARECSASALCALNVFEYNSMPQEFYYDFFTQCADEAKHANFYWEEFKRQIPIISALGRDEPVVQQVLNYNKTGTGLLLPKEGVFYDLYWNCSLSERLCLMNIDTEAAGLFKFKQRIEWAQRNHLHELAAGMTIDHRDEKFHAKIGRRWFKYLFPNAEIRKSELVLARSIRGFLVFSCKAVADNSSIINTIKEWQVERVT